jgi:putative heme-binding domain-containing protein
MALRDDFQEAVSGKYGLQLGRDWQIYGDVGLGIPTEGGASLVASAIEASSFQATPELPRQLEHIARYSPARGEEMWKLVLAVRSRGTAYHAELMQAVLRGLQARGAQPQGQTKTYAVGLCNQLFEKTSAPDLKAGIALAQALKEPSLAGSLLKLVADHHCPEAQRTEALTAVAAIDPTNAAGPLARLLTDGGEPVTLREKTAQTLAGLNRPEANAELVKALPTAEARLASAIAAGLAGTSAGAGQLLDAVAAGKASARLLQEQAVLLKLQQSKLQQLRERLAELTKGLSPVDQKVTQLLLKRRDSFRSAKADPALGAKVYTAQCAACHQVGGQGAKVGPQLDGVGIRGLERLLEDILDPNRNVDQAFRATSIELKSGQVLTGLVLREEGEVVVLADAQGKEQRVAKSSIAERTVTPLSPMPANFDQSVSEADMNHLMAYLLTLRPK